MTKKFSVITLLIVGCGVYLLAGCGSTSTLVAGAATPTADTSPAQVKVAEVVKDSLSSEVSYQANVQAKKSVTVVAKLGGRLAKVNVDVGSKVKAGDILIEQERDALLAQVAQAEAALSAAQAKYDGLQAGPRDEQIAQAEANVKVAQARLDQLKAGPTAEQIAQAEAQVALAKDQLYSVQTQADAYLNSRAVAMGTAVYTKDMKEAASGVAYEQIRVAEAALAELKAGATAEQIAQAEGSVEAAKQQLALVKQPTTTWDAKAAEAAVAQAQAAVDLARTQLADATIKAPFDGVVAQKMVNEGVMAASGTPLLTLLTDEVEVVINVDEASLPNLKTGQTGKILTTAYPDREIVGTVTNIAPSVDSKTRTVPVRLTPSDGTVLRDGMSAQVKLSWDQAGAPRDVLLVTSSAVFQENGQSLVFVIRDGRAERRAVTTGASSGERIEITSGLSQGEKVAITGLLTLKDGQKVEVQ